MQSCNNHITNHFIVFIISNKGFIPRVKKKCYFRARNVGKWNLTPFWHPDLENHLYSVLSLGLTSFSIGSSRNETGQYNKVVNILH